MGLQERSTLMDQSLSRVRADVLTAGYPGAAGDHQADDDGVARLPRLLSPIEEAFSKIKALIRAAGARTRAALDQAIAAALEAVNPADAAGWFANAGYPTRQAA
jgi:hypothetical protein